MWFLVLFPAAAFVLICYGFRVQKTRRVRAFFEERNHRFIGANHAEDRYRHGNHRRLS